jgi:hypothetical protein
MNKLILLLLSIILISSCNKEEPIGKWDDIIKLSTKNVEFGVKPDSVIITTEGDWWWIDGISLDDSTYSYYNNENVNLESDSYIITETNFVVERRDKHTLFIKLDENITGKERVMIIGLEAGDYFDSVTIKQSAK